MSEIEIFIKNFFDEVEKLYNAVPGVEDGFGVDFLVCPVNLILF